MAVNDYPLCVCLFSEDFKGRVFKNKRSCGRLRMTVRLVAFNFFEWAEISIFNFTMLNSLKGNKVRKSKCNFISCILQTGEKLLRAKTELINNESLSSYRRKKRTQHGVT